MGKITKNNYRNSLRIKEKVAYICTPQTRVFGPGGSGKAFIHTLKKQSRIFFRKSFADHKKVVCLHPLKTATSEAKKFIKIMFIVVDWGLKKNFQKKTQKNIAGSKKGFYICTRLAIEIARRDKKTSSLTYWIDSVAGYWKRYPATKKRTDCFEYQKLNFLWPLKSTECLRTF